MLSVSSPITTATDLHMHSEQTTLKVQQPRQRREISASSSSVQVAVRIRPLLPFEYEHGSEPCIQVYPSYNDQSNLYKSLSSDSASTSAWADSQHSVRGLTLSPSPSISSYQTLQVGEGDGHTYTFDHVFPSSSTQHSFYDQSVTPLVASCLEGYNATVLAYGQTGSGKTHTILGQASGTIDDVEGTRSNEGVIPRALRQIFNGLENTQQEFVNEIIREDAAPGESDSDKNAGSSNATSNSFEYHIKIQFLELYGEDIRDLLLDDDADSSKGGSPGRTPKQRLKKQISTSSIKSSQSTRKRRTTLIVRDGQNGEDAEVLGAHKAKVESANQALELLMKGLNKRVVGKTAMNANSSRSHAIFTIVVQQTRRNEVGQKKEVEMKTSKIHFVDLSGSESIKRSKTAGKSLKEGIDINKGLLVLGNVISALGSKRRGSKTHIPYRDSKLTRLLKGSLGGNHKTLMIACVSPSPSNTVESISTLRYASRAKNIKNKAKINVDPASRVVNELKSQVVALAAELLRVKKKKQGSSDDDDELEECPFSIEFLDDLVGATGSQSVWKRNRLRKTALSPIAQMRPMTEPVSSTSHDDSWEANTEKETEIIQKMHESAPIFDHRDDDNSSTSAEDPDLDKNIISYDFALSKLKESLNEATNEAFVNGGDRPFTPGLGKVRNIDELYDYLHKHDSFELESDEQQTNTCSSESGHEVRNDVVSDHVTKLDETITYNETLLNEMTNCHKRYEVLMDDYQRELERTKGRVDFYEQEKKKVENVVDLMEEGSQYSDNMIEAVREKEAKIHDLEKKCAELKMLTKVANQNNDDIQKLRNSIDVMKHQRTELKQMAETFSKSSTFTDSIPPSHAAYDHEVIRTRQVQIEGPPSIERPYSLKNELQPGRHNDSPEHDHMYNSLDTSRQFKSNNESTPQRHNTAIGNYSSNITQTFNQERHDDFKTKIIESHERDEIRMLKNEIAELKQMLVKKDNQQARMHFLPEEQNWNEKKDLQRVPTTLNLIQNNTDLSGLEEELKLGSQQNEHYKTSKPSLSSAEFEKVRRQIYGTQNDNVEKRQVSDTNNISAILDNSLVYDLGKKVNERRRVRKAYIREEEDIGCEDICAGPLYVVKIIRGLFGRRKDAVLRQW